MVSLVALKHCKSAAFPVHWNIYYQDFSCSTVVCVSLYVKKKKFYINGFQFNFLNLFLSFTESNFGNYLENSPVFLSVDNNDLVLQNIFPRTVQKI